ncbi:MAG TPA: metal ABC transporter ATP-binding protein [Chlamydiales bacterium]|nr:metal ABC transporter ATP-binding protein [Chlamydiales bacterium]
MKEAFAIEAEGLHVHLGKKVALWDLNFQIPKGLLVGVLGPNGAGKSTLFKTALGLISPVAGRIELLGTPVSKIRRKVAYVPQRESIDWDFPITAGDVVLMGRFGKMGLFGSPRKADLEAKEHAMQKLGIAHLAGRQIGELSGGQQQRLFVARALLQDADLLLLDEPFAGIDATTEKVIIDILQELKRRGKTILLIHHDLSQLEHYFDWTLLLNTRLISCGPTATSATPDLLAKAFGKREALFDEASVALAKNLTGAP